MTQKCKKKRSKDSKLDWDFQAIFLNDAMRSYFEVAMLDSNSKDIDLLLWLRCYCCKLKDKKDVCENVKEVEKEIYNVSWIDAFDRNIDDEMLKEILLTQRVWQESWWMLLLLQTSNDSLMSKRLIKVIWLLMI